MRKLVIATGVAVALGLGLVAPAVAQYGGEAPAVSDVSGEPGVTNSASGPAGSCQAGATVTVSIDGEVVATGTAEADGSYSVSFTNPDEPGEYVLSVSC